MKPVVEGLKRFGRRGVLEGIVLGAEIYEVAGASWLQGGMASVVGGKVKYLRLEQYPGDWPNEEEFTTCLETLIDPSNKTSGTDRKSALSRIKLDYQAGLNTWLDARERKKVDRKKNGVRPKWCGMQLHIFREVRKEKPVGYVL